MESEGSDNDSLTQVDEAELTEEYHASEWHDKSCAEPVEATNVQSASALCHACRNLLSGNKVFQTFYKHYYYLSSFRTAADRGCHLCSLTRSKIDKETQNHRPSETLRLTAEIYPPSMKSDGNAFQIWFHHVKIPLVAGRKAVVWGVKTIVFLPAEGW